MITAILFVVGAYTVADKLLKAINTPSTSELHSCTDERHSCTEKPECS